MAIIKTFKGTKIGSNITSYWLSGSATATQANYITSLDRNNYALFQDESSTKHYFADSTNDSLSLVPEFDKDLSFSNLLKMNLRNSFTRKMLFTSKPVLNCVRDFTSTELDEELYGSIYMNYSLKSNLDLEQLHAQGNLKSFQDNNDTYTLFVIPNQNVDAGASNQTVNVNTAPGSKVVLALGDDLSQAQIIEYDFERLNLDLLSVNPEKQIIYLMGAYDGYWSRSDGELFSSNYPEQYIVALKYKTIGADNAFEFFPDHQMLLHFEGANIQTSFNRGAYTNLFYLGLDSANTDCFGLLSSNPNLNSNNTLDLVLLRINYTQLTAATTSTLLNDNKIKYLDCFDIHTISLAADPNVPNDYAQQHNAIPSKLFNFDSSNPNDYHFYIPLFKNNGNLSPMVVKWEKDQSTWADAFTYHENLISTLSVEGGANGDTTSHLVNPASHLPSLLNYAASYDAYWATHITKNSGGDHSLHFIFNYIGKKLYDEINPIVTSKLNNCLSFGINANDPKALTYESLSTFNNLNALLHKDSSGNYTELASLSSDGYKSYSYTSGGGWTQSHYEPGTFTEYTEDSYSRRWAIEPPPQSSYTNLVTSGYMYYDVCDVKLHLISQVLPNTTSIEFANTNLTYQGTPLNNTIKVNAYDSSGARIAKNVRLTIEGTNVTFASSNSTTTVVTTSLNSDKDVAIQIAGPGYVNVSASFDI